MHILSIGINHTSAPLTVRERLAFGEEQIRASLSRFGCGDVPSHLSEFVILSTCNRTEIYAVSDRRAYTDLEDFLARARDVDLHDFRSYLYHRHDLDAAQHLFAVAAGLDSLVIGEPQILGQITRALELARGQNAAGPVLNRLFQSAIHAGKRARTETAISRNPASVSSLAASVADKALGSIESARVAVLGAGETAELTVEALRKRGVARIRVINRTLERARTLSDRWGAEPATFEFLPQALLDTDILISSTGAPHLIIEARMVEEAMHVRPEQPLVLIDIAVPRNIDPDCASIPGVRLFDMDGLNAQLVDALSKRMDEVPHVQQILAEELAEFETYLRSLEMLPIISDIHQQAEIIRAAELERTLRRLPHLSEAERARIEALTQSLVRKLLDSPTRRLLAEAASHRAPEFAALARTLFNLSDEADHTSSAVAE